MAKADKLETDIVKQVDEYIEINELDVPIEILPDLRDGYEVREILELELEAASIASVIWATGYKFDFSMVKLPAFDADGYPLQQRGVTEYPGLYFIGLPFLHTFKSGILAGVGDDAAHVAGHIGSRVQLTA